MLAHENSQSLIAILCESTGEVLLIFMTMLLWRKAHAANGETSMKTWSPFRGIIHV